MAVEFITTDAEAIKQIESLYESAFDFKNGTWAVFAQVYKETYGVRVKAALIEPYWAEQIRDVLRRRLAQLERRKKRAKKGMGSHKENQHERD